MKTWLHTLPCTQWLASRLKLCVSQQASFYYVTENKLNKFTLFSPSQCCAYRSCHVHAHSYFHIVTAGGNICSIRRGKRHSTFLMSCHWASKRKQWAGTLSLRKYFLETRLETKMFVYALTRKCFWSFFCKNIRKGRKFSQKLKYSRRNFVKIVEISRKFAFSRKWQKAFSFQS